MLRMWRETLIDPAKGPVALYSMFFGGFPFDQEKEPVKYLDQVRAPGVVYSWWISLLGLMPKFLWKKKVLKLQIFSLIKNICYKFLYCGDKFSWIAKLAKF